MTTAAHAVPQGRGGPARPAGVLIRDDLAKLRPAGDKRAPPVPVTGLCEVVSCQVVTSAECWLGVILYSVVA